MSVRTEIKRLTTRDIRAFARSGEKIAMLTAYDHVMAGLLDQAGVEIIPVGDSLGNVVLGYETTLPVTLDDMIRHASAVYRGTARAMVVCDLPFGTAKDPETALSSAIAVLQQTGCQAVKIEGGGAAASTVARLVEQGIPAMGHIGLTPQAMHQLGGYYRHGKDTPGAHELIAAARDLQRAGLRHRSGIHRARSRRGSCWGVPKADMGAKRALLRRMAAFGNFLVDRERPVEPTGRYLSGRFGKPDRQQTFDSGRVQTYGPGADAVVHAGRTITFVFSSVREYQR